MTTGPGIASDASRWAPARVTHIVDATKGPLVGAGRLRRVAPFAITSSLGVVVGAPATTWARPDLAVAGSVGVAVTIIISVVCPWERLPRLLQLAPPVGFLVATLLLISASDTDLGSPFSSPFVTMSVLPLVWLAVYESRWAVMTVGSLTATSLWLLVPAREDAPPSQADTAFALFLICAVGMGITLQGLVADTRQVTRQLRSQQAALETSAMMLDVMPEYVTRYRVVDHVITYHNAAWAEQFCSSSTSAVGRPLEDFLSDDELVGLAAQLALLGPDTPVLEDSTERGVAGRRGMWLHWIDRYLVGPDGDEILSIGRDVSARHDAEIELTASEARYRALADGSADVVWHFALEPTPHFDYMSPSVERILGYPPEYFLEDFSRMLEILDEPGRTAIGRAIHGERLLQQFDFHFRRLDGSLVIGETRTSVVPGGLQGVSRDVTETRRLQAEVAALALRDPLTGLANRRLLEELLDVELMRTARDGAVLAVAFLDLDGFKHVNDLHGHHAGDLVLCETARRLLDAVRSADTVARVGGDEFVVVYEPDDSDSQPLIERIEATLSAPFIISPTAIVHCPASVGVAETCAVGYDRYALLAAADRAMYEMKRTRAASPSG